MWQIRIPFISFQIKEIILWNFGRAFMSGQKEDSILKVDSDSVSVGIESSKIIYSFLYLNRRAFSIKIQDFGSGDILNIKCR